ncbi:MAG TPA: glycine--tRNA ligase subunit beta [Oscillatoriales cyanobacterium M59_W2019_021]|nr:glycine--tRNA ligase subunit beta [Oscillatoriales cyanobacterium M4454_W2019_049]HIK52141.1 glycine--tRNA ligase subunit beta [Oscillatoriales cyanobacterium M59_W2019_021]
MATFLLEVGTEELPASFVSSAIAQWQSRIPASLAQQSLTPQAVRVYGTPRRLAVEIEGLPQRQSDRTEEVKGPPASAAFKDGKPTPAAVGFARKQGVDVESLSIRDTEKGEFVFVTQQISGRQTPEILRELVSEWIENLEGKRFMRWADGELRFSRPIRWLVALFDDAVLPIELTVGSQTVKSDRLSYGHRVLSQHPEGVAIPRAADYADCLRRAFVEVDAQRREADIRQQVEAAAKQVGGRAEIPEDLLQEVTNLVEWPTAVTGNFDEEFLILPSEVTTMVMISHQRYFPVFNLENDRQLLPYFITVSNGDPAKSELIAKGNERVIRARLADGEFFYKADCEKPLESFVPQLETVTFQEKLGSVRAKVDRLVSIADTIADELQLEIETRQHIQRAAYLCKADLVSQMVYEFPELQGIMGEKYARVSGEAEAVAVAISEHYLPRGADDDLPQTTVGQIVGLADRLDTLVCIFGLGMLPSGSSDPFALRRAANAIVNIIWAADLPLNLNNLLEKTTASFTHDYPQTSADLLSQLQDFFGQRIQTLLQDDRAVDYDLVNAVLGEDDPEYRERVLTDLLDARDRALFLQSIRANGLLDTIYETVNRSTRLAKQGTLNTQELEPSKFVQPDLFEKNSEQAFYDALVTLVPKTEAAKADRNYQQLIDALVEINPIVSRFFDGEDSVLVMDSNPKIKQNRLNLLGLLRNHARVLADFGAIVKS